MRRLLPAVVALSLFALLAGAADPPKESGVKPVNLDKLNTEADEDDPFLSSNGVLYYASNANKKFDILCSQRRAATEPWKPGKLPDGYLKHEVDDRSIFLTPEGYYPQYVYFATKTDKKINNFDIYVAVKQGPNAAISAPTPVNSVCTEADEMHPWLVGGKHLYFSRKTDDGWRVFVASRKDVTGAAGFDEPVLIKELPPGFHHATLTPDGKTMYLQGLLEMKRWGLFRSTWDGKAWSKPEELTELNDPEGFIGDRSPALSRDGTLLYFSSDRPGGKGNFDIWVVPTAQLKKK
jgi:hypothetical protein